jgi:hypothetical protein
MVHVDACGCLNTVNGAEIYSGISYVLLLDSASRMCGVAALLGVNKPAKADMLLFVFADGFTFRARPDVALKVALVDLKGELFPRRGHLPQHTLPCFRASVLVFTSTDDLGIIARQCAFLFVEEQTWGVLFFCTLGCLQSLGG